VLIEAATVLGDVGHRLEKLASAAVARQDSGSPFALVAPSVEDQIVLEEWQIVAELLVSTLPVEFADRAFGLKAFSLGAVFD